jgi:hypothetical protein
MWFILITCCAAFFGFVHFIRSPEYETHGSEGQEYGEGSYEASSG